ncbi:hypothetical protein F503_06129 [Ophiostoma piceae UAMH 11346]|uniref:Uncharacterized protein n=1 Tax=Ophiostoma piceae (strain UAMH 11346) TaxID=1262450 RepID=S3C7R4_OPHP1|nr:hypothetical protein F503_06129 [Ophiostoma piceae UAMH 11346]
MSTSREGRCTLPSMGTRRDTTGQRVSKYGLRKLRGATRRVAYDCTSIRGRCTPGMVLEGAQTGLNRKELPGACKARPGDGLTRGRSYRLNVMHPQLLPAMSGT